MEQSIFGLIVEYNF